MPLYCINFLQGAREDAFFFSQEACDLLVPWAENHLSSFRCGFLNIFSLQNLLRSLSCLRWNKYSAKKCPKNHIPFDFLDDSTLANHDQGAGKTIEKPLKELPWDQQDPKFLVDIFDTVGTRN